MPWSEDAFPITEHPREDKRRSMRQEDHHRTCYNNLVQILKDLQVVEEKPEEEAALAGVVVVVGVAEEEEEEVVVSEVQHQAQAT